MIRRSLLLLYFICPWPGHLIRILLNLTLRFTYSNAFTLKIVSIVMPWPWWYWLLLFTLICYLFLQFIHFRLKLLFDISIICWSGAFFIFLLKSFLSSKLNTLFWLYFVRVIRRARGVLFLRAFSYFDIIYLSFRGRFLEYFSFLMIMSRTWRSRRVWIRRIRSFWFSKLWNITSSGYFWYKRGLHRHFFIYLWKSVSIRA